MIAAEKKLNDVQETKIENPLVEENTDKKDKVHWSDYEEFFGFTLASCTIRIINSGAMLCLILLALVQIFAWKKSFNNKWNSDTQKQFDQMILSAIAYMSVFILSRILDLVSITGRRDLIRLWRIIRWKDFLVIIIIALCFSNVFVIFVWRSKAAAIFVEFTFQDEYALSKIPSSLLYLKFLCIFSSVQNIALLATKLLMESDYSNFISNDDECSSKAVTKEEQTIPEEKDEEVCENYIIC